VGLDGPSLGVNELKSRDAKVSRFDPTNNFADKLSLDAAGLDENKGGFNCHGLLQFTGGDTMGRQ
jgi:hypothetical protein